MKTIKSGAVKRSTGPVTSRDTTMPVGPGKGGMSKANVLRSYPGKSAMNKSGKC